MLPILKGKSTPSAKGAFARALERFAARKRGVRLGFLIDATSSRGATWEAAQRVQAKMFRAASTLSALSLRLIHFGGGEMTDCGWISNPRAVAAHMAGVHCAAGYTQILPALAAFAGEAPETRADAIILIGDCFEEDASCAEALATALKAAGIRVFAFLEGNDWTAEDVFRRLADITGGRFARLGEDLPLDALCEGVALLTAGGASAVQRLENKRVRQLLLTGPSRK